MSKQLNILFLTITRFQNVEDTGIYTDLMRKFRDEGHHVYVVTPLERRYDQKTSLRENNGINILGVQTLNLQKTNIFEKGVGTILIDYQFKNAIKKYLKDQTFDLVVYSTPPITFSKSIQYIKNKYQSLCYLLLKDIFPQNAIDLGLMNKNSFLHTFFRKKEIKLYKISDVIGCMSPANKHYILKHNSYIDQSKVEVNPNSIEIPKENNEIDIEQIRDQYNIPQQTTTFIYGGNFGKPQNVDYIIDILKTNQNRKDCFFVLVGSGTEFYKLEKWFSESNPKNILLLNQLPITEYNHLVQACDVGLIFLDHRFTIPNYPSRLLTYLLFRKPIIASTDPYSDMGTIAVENNYGFYCESNSINEFNLKLEYCIQHKEEIQKMGKNGYQYLKENFTVDRSYESIMNHFHNK